MYFLPKIWVGIVLLAQSVFDLRKKEIPTSISIVGGVVGFLLSAYVGECGIERVFALIPGGICFICCRITNGAVGYGDAILLMSMAMVYSLRELGFICCISLGIAGIAALVLFVIFHKKGNYEIPFVPFLVMGWAIELWAFGEGNL